MDAPSEGESEGLMARVKSSFRWCYSKCCGKRENEAEMKTVSLFTGYFFFINYIVGTGFLGLPYAFYFSGILAGMLTLMVVSFISYNTANWTVEAMARAQVCAKRGGSLVRGSHYIVMHQLMLIFYALSIV